MNDLVRLASLGALLSVSACTPAAEPGDGEGEGEGEGECALSPLARALLEQTVSEHFVHVAFATTTTHGGGGAPTDVGFGHDLVGLDVGVLQNASLFFPCTEPALFVPTCEAANPDPFFAAHDRCFRLGCVDVDVPLVDVYFTMRPTTEAEERHAFTTTTTAPAGTSSYAENPLVRWVADLSVPDNVAIHADIDIAHVFASDGETVDVSHAGTVDGTHAIAADVTLDIALAFGALAGDPVLVEVHGADALTGSVTMGGVALDAAIDLGAPLPFAWVEGCASE